ncbi:hypothetical protein THIAE_09070 [Thiomicrospira aerophila AL3]|uniref:Glycosyltransferase RgtA/B/C/D-like domain-containing protein n=1 Tax=Thiomicrospira aerophila AL3 TaxID=717772 RepID=W0DZF9_9GAMM|nr:glycosyltransferase family 39 protein [Thiomicrospira aerophila]AHF02374.1 hypothetical protein THIAE_09070 [Thiomicrospira aerophila AL3]
MISNRLFASWLPHHPAAQWSSALILLISAWHLWLAGQVGLSVDEAHYGLYALHPALSYFDHPPMIGWLLIPSVSLGQAEWLLRLPAILLWALSNAVLYHVSLRLFPQQAWLGFWTLLLVNSAVMMQLLGLAPLPEAPLILFSLLSLLALLNIRESNSWQAWLGLGLCLGLAALSKYTAITLVISLLLIMLIERRFYWLSQLKTWIAVLVTLLMISPILIWNYQHEWLSFSYQLDHGTRDPNWLLGRFFAGQAAQLVVYGPLLFIGGLLSVLWLWRFWREPNARLVIIFALPILLLFGYGGGHKMTLPHWTALAWLFLAPLLIHWLYANWQRAWLKTLVVIHAIWVVGLTLALNLLLVMPQLAKAPNHPLQELHGWPEVVDRAQAWQSKLADQQQPVSLWVTNWTHASRLAWYAYPEPVYVDDRRIDQFDLWFPLPETLPEQALFIWPNYGDKLRDHATLRFERCQLLERIDYPDANQPSVYYHLYLCQPKGLL